VANDSLQRHLTTFPPHCLCIIIKTDVDADVDDVLLVLVGPLDVELIGRKDPVSVGRLYEFRCQSVGARPPPVITWWRGSIQLRENVTDRVILKVFIFFLSGQQKSLEIYLAYNLINFLKNLLLRDFFINMYFKKIWPFFANVARRPNLHKNFIPDKP
jgi:hypothetical protein